MSQEPAEPVAEDTAMNPYAAPAVTGDRACRVIDHGALCGSEAESVRFALARTEANLKGLGIVTVVLGVYYGLFSARFAWIAYQVSQGVVSAPWLTRPFWIVASLLMIATSGLGLITGFGLRRQQRWSRGLGFVLAGTWVAFGLLGCGEEVWKADIPSACVGFLSILVPLIPMGLLLDPNAMDVLSNKYRAVVRQTPYLKVRSRLPLGIIAAAGSLLIVVTAMTVALAIRDFPGAGGF